MDQAQDRPPGGPAWPSLPPALFGGEHGDAEFEKMAMELLGDHGDVKAEPADSKMDDAVPSALAQAMAQASAQGRRRKQSTRRKPLRPQQQALVDMEDKLQDLLLEYQAAIQENARLKARIRVIEAVLPQRQQTPAVSAEAGGTLNVASPGTSAGQEEGAAALAGSLPAPTPGSPARYGLPPSARIQPAGAGARSASPAPGSQLAGASEVSGRSGERSSSPPGSEACSRSTGGEPGGVGRGPSSLRQGSVVSQGTSAQDKSDLWMAAWVNWTREAALLICAYEARPAEEHLHRMEAAFDRLKARVVELGLPHSELISNMDQRNLDTGVAQAPPFSFWRVVVERMACNAAQVAACRAALALYRERMEVVMQQRRKLAERLADSMRSLQLAAGQDGGSLRLSNQLEKTSVEAEAAAAELDANVAAEGHAMRLARELLRSDIFTPLQRARISVLSYPYFPDALAIVATIAGETELPSAEGVAAAD